MHLTILNGTRTPGGACGLIMESNTFSVVMECPLMANGAEIFRFDSFVKTAKIERKIRAPRKNINISAGLFQMKLK
jgi:hypothetical protein